MDDIIALLATETLLPCTAAEVEQLEQQYEIKFPAVYKQFLLTMGKSAGRFMLGSSCFFDELPFLEEGAKELLQENNFKELPPNAFVFWMHQGYQFAFFMPNEGDNPPVYYYHEAHHQTDFIKKELSLTDFYKIQLAMSGIVK